jgi:1,4-dihydroxy-2-naphthoate octaprenyltransferase
MAGILYNDLTDYQDDKTVGKKRWICRLPKALGAMVILLIIGVSMVVVVASNRGDEVLLVYGFSVLLGMSYSSRPLRFKDRGVLGLIAYSLSNTLVFVIMPWLWIGSKSILLLVLTPAVLVDKWVNLHFHQIVDYDSDLHRKTRTYVVKVGLEHARNTLKYSAALASALMLALITYLVYLLPIWRILIILAGVAGLIGSLLFIKFLRQDNKNASSLVRELPWPYLGLTGVGFRILPLVLFVRLALQEPMIWIVVAIVGILLMLESLYAIRYRYE